MSVLPPASRIAMASLFTIALAPVGAWSFGVVLLFVPLEFHETRFYVAPWDEQSAL